MSTPHTDIPEKAAPVVVPADDAPWPGISPETAAALDAIDVDLRGGYTMSGEAIAEDTKEFADTRFVLLADLPAIIRAWGSAALPIVLASRDSETAELRAEIEALKAKLNEAYQHIGEQALIDMEEPIPPYGSPERDARVQALRGGQGE